MAEQLIKCPICESSDKLTLEWEDTDSHSSLFVREYSCGCGATFEAIFECKATATKILGGRE